MASVRASNDTCVCDPDVVCAKPPVDFADPVLYVKLAASLVLMCLSGLFSGLTLGLLGLDLNTLSIVSKSDPKPSWRKYAKKIIPLRRDGNLLLCTLLLGNVMVNAAFSILTSDLTSGVIGFIVSSALIVVFGEILPQSICSRYALPIGAYTRPIVVCFVFLLFPLAYPLSLLLDFILGQELGQLYNNEGLKELLELHAQNQGTELGSDSAVILQGAIDFTSRTVGDIMTKIDKCFMLEASEKLDVDNLSKIWQTGHSRIPVFKESRDNIVGLLFTKDLILLNPEEEIPLKTVLTFYGREALRVFEDTHLNAILSLFKTGKSHLAIVEQVVEPSEGDPYYKPVGLVTLEDVIEEIIKDEIVDETDQYRSNEENTKIKQHNRVDMINTFSKRSKSHRLTPKQVTAVSSYLTQSSKYFQMLPENVLQQLLGKSMVVQYKKEDRPRLYKRGERATHFTLLLTGKVEVLSGKDAFQSELGPWSFMGLRALTEQTYHPDFDAVLLQDTQCLEIKQSDFAAVVQNVARQPNFHLPPELRFIVKQTKDQSGNVTFPVDDPDKSPTERLLSEEMSSEEYPPLSVDTSSRSERKSMSGSVSLNDLETSISPLGRSTEKERFGTRVRAPKNDSGFENPPPGNNKSPWT